MKHFIYVIFLISILSCAKRDHLHTSNNSGTQLSATSKLEGAYVYINQKAYEVKSTLNATLNEILPNYEGKTVSIELNTTEYQVDAPIVLPSALQSRVIINGNHASIVSTVPQDEFVFYKPVSLKHGITGAADTYQDIRNLTIKGTGGGVRLMGGYQSKVINVRTRQMHRGILMEFILQGKVEDCHIVHPKDFGIKLTTISGYDINITQCNMSSVINNRVLANGTDVGIYIGNSNLVKLDGNIIEGATINKGVYFHSNASTVVSFNMSRTHFECKKFNDACVYFDGAIDEALIDEMYYSGKGGYAIQSECNKRSDIRISNSWLYGWIGCLKTEDPVQFPNGKFCKKTYWYIYTTEVDKLGFLFDKTPPLYVYRNNSKVNIK